MESACPKTSIETTLLPPKAKTLRGVVRVGVQSATLIRCLFLNKNESQGDLGHVELTLKGMVFELFWS